MKSLFLRMRLVPLRNLGGCISPDNSWIFLQGLETLPRHEVVMREIEGRIGSLAVQAEKN